MKDVVKEYSNGDVTVIWDSAKCIHSGNCVRNLKEVFNPKQSPWIQMDNAKSDAIVETVQKCPSGALKMKNERKMDSTENVNVIDCVVRVGGPLLVKGNIKVTHEDGSVEDKENVTAFCRCGASGKQPYCDGSHNKLK